MIKITAETKGDRTEISTAINGTGEDITNEAVHIMQKLPEHIKNADQLLFFRLLVKLAETGVFWIDTGLKNRGEADDDDE